MLSSTKEQISKVQAETALAKPRKPWYILATTILVWQIAAVLLVEGSLFVAGLGEEEIYKLDPVLGFRHMCNKKITWRSEGFATSYFDKEGLREPGITVSKPVGTYRVALLGDSLTESLQVPVEQSFGYEVQNRLTKELGRPVQVINFGTSGYSTVQEYLQLKSQVLKFKPDLVLCCYNSRDCFENWSPPDEVLTNVRPAALHLPGQKLTVDSSPVTQWMKTPRARFLKNVELLREQSRLWGLYSAAELDWSMHNETYKKLSLFLTRPGKAIRQTAAELKEWWHTQIATGFGSKPTVKNEPAKLAVVASTKPAVVAAAKKVDKVEQPSTKAASVAVSAATSTTTKEKAASTSTPTSSKSPAKTSAAPVKAGRLNYKDLIVRTLGSLFYEMKNSSELSGAKFAVVALPVRSALSAKQGMQTAFLDFDYNDEIKMLEGVCKEKNIPLINVHEKAKALSSEDKDYLFFLVHYTQKGHEFVANSLTPMLKDCIVEEQRK